MIKKLLVGALAFLAASAVAHAQLPPINGVAGPTTSVQFRSIITNPVGTGSVLFGTSVSTTVNGQTCTLGASCTVTAVASSVVAGTTTITGVTNLNGLLFNSSNVLTNLASANSGVLVTNGSGIPSISTTLPTGVVSTGTVATATGAVTARSLASHFADEFNLLDFAAVCDGVTDDSAALQAAVTAAGQATGRGVVTIPGLTCLVNSTITVPAGVTVQGTGWKSVISVTSNAVGTLFTTTANNNAFRNFVVNGTTIVSPTYTAFRINTTGGENTINHVWVFGVGTGIKIDQSNGSTFFDLRIQSCDVACIQTGGTSGVFPGDLAWHEITLIPTSAGVGWIMDMNTNAQYIERMSVVGGLGGVLLRGTGAYAGGDVPPSNIFIWDSDIDAQSAYAVSVIRAFNLATSNTNMSGVTAGPGLLINAAAATNIDGITLSNPTIRGNFKDGIEWRSGCNVKIDGGKIYANSNGSGTTYNGITAYYTSSTIQACGLLQATGVLFDPSRFGNVGSTTQGHAVYLDTNTLTSVANFPGRLSLHANTMTNQGTTAMVDASVAPEKSVGLNNLGYRSSLLSADALFVDATYDIGKSGATRPRDGFFSRNLVIGGTLTYGGVALTAAVTGTGSMVLSASPALTGTIGADSMTGTGTIRANTSFNANGTAGASATVSVRKGDDSGACNLVFSLGLYVSTTC